MLKTQKQIKRGYHFLIFFQNNCSERNNSRHIHVRLDKIGNRMRRCLQVFLYRFAGEAHLTGYLIVLQTLVAAKQIYLLLLRRQVVNSLIQQAVVGIQTAVIFREQYHRVLFDGFLAEAFFGEFAQAVERVVFGYYKQIGPEMLYSGKAFAAQPDLQEHILHHFFGKFCRTGLCGKYAYLKAGDGY
jgi:hypothetical protein